MNDVIHKPTSSVPALSGMAVGEEEILSGSLLIPYVLLMQGLSDFVADRKAQLGDIVRGGSAEKLGDPETPVEIIPLTFTNTWALSEKVGGKYEFRKQEPLNAANQDLPWDFKQNGADWKRTKSLNLFALVKKDVDAEQAEAEKVAKGGIPDPSKGLLPVLISFRSTSYKAGKGITNHFAMAKKMGVPAFVSVLRLTSNAEKNEKGNFFTFGINHGGETPQPLLEICSYWRTQIATRPVVVESEDAGDETPTQGPAASTTLNPGSKF